MTKKRQKASEVYQAAPHFLGAKTASFKEAFPGIEAMKIEVEEEGEGTTDWQGNWTRNHYYSASALPGPYIDCSNPLCYNGGLAIGGIVSSMVARRETDLETSETCQGYEGSPKGRKKYRDCLNVFRVKVHLEFKD